MASHTNLHGSCSCERNRYTIAIPSTSVSLAQVFFDNSAANRRSQATPITAWLRIPLAWYQSSTFAYFPDETHSSIKRTFSSPSSSSLQPNLSPTRRQFCGYCGTHLTAWSEGHTHGGRDSMDVTLGSLGSESLELLERLGVTQGEQKEEDEEDGLKRGGSLDEEQHVPSASTDVQTPRLQHVGMPYFESMVEDSRLGRMKRMRGGQTSRDGRTVVQWEVIEMEDE